VQGIRIGVPAFPRKYDVIELLDRAGISGIR
jgi:hypothetical protein